MSKEDMSGKDRFDRMSVDIGTGLISLQMMITEFVIELLLQENCYSCDLDLAIPHQFTDEFTIVRVKGLSYDYDRNELTVHSDQDIRWDDLNLVAQDLIAAHLHITYTSKNYFSELS